MQLYAFAAGPYHTNCYVLINAETKQAAVIDPGMHARSRVEKILKEENATLSMVICTHGHIDHTRDAGELANAAGVPVWLHEADRFMLEDGGVSEQATVLFDVPGMERPNELRDLNHGEPLSIVGMDFELRHAPGHSPGSVLFVGEHACFSGDVLFNNSIGRTDLPGSDPQAMMDSLKHQVMTLPDELAILPGHGPDTTMRAERRSNPFLRGLD